MSIEKKIIKLHTMWENTSSETISQNINRILTEDRKMARWADRMDYLAYITQVTKHAAYSWMNKGRKNVKVPFIKLCMIADKLNISIEELMKENNMEKFCIDLIKGNTKKTLATFDTKEEAFAAGEQFRKDNPNEPGMYVCNAYQYDEDGNRYNARWRQFMEW